MHDDQHGTAIISSAALAKCPGIAEEADRQGSFCDQWGGGGGHGLCKLYVALGARPENFILFDKDGVLHEERTDLDETKKKFAVKKVTGHSRRP